MVHAQIQLTESQARILERIAAEKETTVTELIRQSIDDLIRHNKDIDGGKQLDAEREERRHGAPFPLSGPSPAVWTIFRSITMSIWLKHMLTYAGGDLILFC